MKKLLFILGILFSFQLPAYNGQFAFDAGYDENGFIYGFSLGLFNKGPLGLEFGAIMTDPLIVRDDLDESAVAPTLKKTTQETEIYSLGAIYKFEGANIHFGGFVGTHKDFEVYNTATPSGGKELSKKINTETELGAYLGISKSFSGAVLGLKAYSSGTATVSLGFEF